MNNLERVREFHEKFGAAVDVEPTNELLDLRHRLIDEEFTEARDEMTNQEGFGDAKNLNKRKLTKELADILYVVYGTAVTFGLPLQEVFEEVHRSNMSKLGPDGKPIYREDGKVLKGPNYKEPDLEHLFK